MKIGKMSYKIVYQYALKQKFRGFQEKNLFLAESIIERTDNGYDSEFLRNPPWLGTHLDGVWISSSTGHFSKMISGNGQAM